MYVSPKNKLIKYKGTSIITKQVNRKKETVKTMVTENNEEYQLTVS